MSTKTTTNKNQRTTDSALESRVCANCRFSRPLYGLKEPALFCKHKAGHERRFLHVAPSEYCLNYESPHLSQAEFEEIKKTGAKLIPLTQGKFAIVDAEDYDRLSKYKWCANKSRRSYYAVRSNGQRQIRMHRMITSAPKGLFVDHINHNGLDNRKTNLRLCTESQNNLNRRPYGKTSRYKGVSRHKKTNRYLAAICYQGKRFHLGTFRDEVDAAKAYDKKARELFGQFAYLNFPEEVREEN